MTSMRPPAVLRSAFVAGVAVALAFAQVAAGAPADPDATFGEHGRAWVSPIVAAIPSPPFLTLRADGASLVLEHDRLSLVDATGVVNPAFGYQERGPANGCPVAPPCPLFQFGRPAFAWDGHILLPFATYNENPPRVGVVRLDANGKRVPGFGAGGTAVRVDADAVSAAAPAAVAMEPDGSVVTIYAMRTTTGDQHVFLARWRSDGSPDGDFGQQGRRVLQFAMEYTGDIVVAFAPDRRIVVGHTGLNRVVNQVSVYSTTVARFLPDGAVDRSFHVARREGTDVPNLVALAVANDGSIVGAGGTRDGSAIPAAFRLHADGRRDPAFGEGGIAHMPVPPQCGSVGIVAAAVDSRGRTVLLGSGTIGRLLANGMPDATFSDDGVACIVDNLGSHAGQVAVDAQDRIVFSSLIQASEARGAHSPVYDTRAAVFRLQGGDAQGPATATRRTAVEFVHPGFSHYFMSADPAEVARLDVDGGGWARTGRTFVVWSEGGAGLVPVCRFWSGNAFWPWSTHFYTPYASECSALRGDPAWSYEGNAFFVQLPRGVEGSRTCGPGSVPLYRAYNNAISGAPNHRYTTDPALLDALVASGWTMEGEARTRVFACVPVQ